MAVDFDTLSPGGRSIWMSSCCLYSRQTVLKPFSGPPPTVRPCLKLRRLSANEAGTSAIRDDAIRPTRRIEVND